MNQRYGYVRVSTKEQCEDRQFIALRELTGRSTGSCCGN